MAVLFADAPRTSYCTAGLHHYAQLLDTPSLVILHDCYPDGRLDIISVTVGLG